MTYRITAFGVDRPQFEQMLDQPLRDHLLAFTDGSQDLAGARLPWRRFATFCDSSGVECSTYYIEAGFKVRRLSGGKRHLVARQQLIGLQELSVRTRDYIMSASGLDFRCLMDLFAANVRYSFVRPLVDGIRRSWIDYLLSLFEYWYGPESSDMQVIRELLERLNGRGPSDENRSLVIAREFPPSPHDNGETLWVDGWTTDETRLVLMDIDTLLEYGGEPPHRESHRAIVGHKRYMFWDEFSEPTPREHEEWNYVLDIIRRFRSLDEYPQPAVISFSNV